MNLRAFLTRRTAHPRILAAEYGLGALVMLLLAYEIVRRTAFVHTPLAAGSLLLALAFATFAVGSWRNEAVRWGGAQRWGIVAGLAGTLLWILPI